MKGSPGGKGDGRRRVTKGKEVQAEKNWAEYERKLKERKAREAIPELYAEIHGNLDKIKQVVH